jgi:NCS1 family nucleobase:cation symporter-1
MIPPEHYRKPFLFTAFTSTITAFSIFFWSLARAKGGGPFINESVEQITGVPAAKGTYLVWYVNTSA